MMQDLEIRFFAGEVRVDMEASNRIRGYAIVFNSLSQNLGGFREIIKPEAIDRTLEEALDVRAMVDHDSGKIIGRTRAGTLSLRKDKRGLRVDIDTADTTAGRDTLVLVRRGDVTGMSFAFRTMPGGDNWVEDEDGNPLREVTDMRVSEVSVVGFPAYLETDAQASRNTEVALRSLREFKKQQIGSRIDWLQKVHQTRLAR